MPDRRFYTTNASLALDEIYALARAIDPDASTPGAHGAIARVASPDEAVGADAVVLCDQKSVVPALAGKRFGLAIVAPAIAESLDLAGPVIKTQRARHLFAQIAQRLHTPRPDEGDPPQLGDGVMAHPTAIIGAGAQIGPRVTLGPYAVIGPGVVLGAQCVVGPHASIGFACLGARVHVFAGVRIGQEGFGFTEDPAGPSRVPQLGRVMIGDDVEIGANVTIDRGALGDTVIGDCVKIDNLVHIAHNVRLGRGCVIAGQVGVAGSSTVGEGVQIGGQAAISDHLVVGDGARIAARAGLVRDVPAGETWGGTPAMPGRAWLRAAAWAARKSKRNAE